MIDFEQEALHRQKSMVSIKVIGVGGAGGNAVNSIIESGCQGIGFVVANTDAQALEFSKAQHKIQIGVKSTKGLGAGANPEIGKRAAEEDLDKVMDAMDGADIVFIVAGMGGGTGSGATPVIARALHDKGVLSIAIVIRPFMIEGKRRAATAEAAIQKLKADVDALIIVPNEKLLEVVDEHVSMTDAFAMVNEGILSQSVRGLSDIITRPGHINVDYADIRTIMKDRGLAVMGTGKASGNNRARTAAIQAISSPLLENMSVVGARGVLCNITGGKDLGLREISEAASVVYEQAHEDANIIIGSVIDENLRDEVVVTIIATDFEHAATVAAQPVQELHVMQSAQPKEELSFFEPVKQEEEHVCAAPVVEEEAIEPLPLQTTVEAVEEDKHDFMKKSHVDFFEQADNTFGGAVDSKDLDVPTFMRQK
ncbi:MAG TPA: cell division protein FtsZ [Candidatus Babeliales bacterium]|jgi:cell division protein FtsZ|nr:cell division protein FtsZ [Candidatus Babeliales bacterium]